MNHQNYQSAGQVALYQRLGMKGPLPHTISYIMPNEGRRRTVEQSQRTEEYYPVSARTDGSLREDLRFAFKNEPLDLRVIVTALSAMGAQEIRAWIQQEPTGRFSRLAWFYFERFVEPIADLPSVTNAPYVDALNIKYHYTAQPLRSTRYRVNDNLLGNGNLCPILRRTRKLEEFIGRNLSAHAHRITSNYSHEMLLRAANYLYGRETRSSFDIEGEVASADREERFLQALREAAIFDAQNKKAFVDLQRVIVEEQFAASDWRTNQVYVSSSNMRGKEHVHYICPKPNDVAGLMDGLFFLVRRALQGKDLDPVLAAAVIAFAFVFIHPFEDGNGRIHRFLIHALLAQRRFTPDGIIFPVSAAILRDLKFYYQTLDSFSLPIKPCIKWQFCGEDEIEVTNETRNLYRFFDATPFAEYLYDRVENTIIVDFQKELDYLAHYDAAYKAVQKIADMPNKDIALMVKLCLQNDGQLSKNKRDRFPRLRDEQIACMEAAIQKIMQTPTVFAASEDNASTKGDN